MKIEQRYEIARENIERKIERIKMLMTNEYYDPDFDALELRGAAEMAYIMGVIDIERYRELNDWITGVLFPQGVKM